MLKYIFITIIRLTTSPQEAWQDLSDESQPQKKFEDKYLHPIIGIIAITSFFGGLWFTASGNLQLALKNTIIGTVTIFTGYYIAAYILKEVAIRFGLAKNEEVFQRFVGYSSALMFALYIVLPLLPDFFILWFFAFYTAYIVYIGAVVYLNVREDKQMNFTVIATILILLIPALINTFLKILIK